MVNVTTPEVVIPVEKLMPIFERVVSAMEKKQPVNVTVEAPPPAQVHAHVNPTIKVPEIKIPKPPAAQVTVNPTIKVNPKLELPKRTTTKNVSYDSDGNVTKVVEREE